MKPLSQSLEELAGRVKVLEDSATATFEANRAELENRRQEIDADFTQAAAAFDADMQQAEVAGHTWWNETRASLKRPVEELRGRVDKRKAEHELHKAVRQAERAEEDAAAAIDLADYFLNVAEYAVIDATLARMTADELAAATPAATAGASS